MWPCFRIPNNGRSPTKEEPNKKKKPEHEQFRFLKGRTEEESFMLENGGRILEELISSLLKLLGCCLETQVPTLVYEFAENGDLSDHIYEKLEFPSKHHPPLTWENRFRIAIEVSESITYLHTGTSKPIIHREIKPRNIFLGKNFVAKLFEFGLSISIPFGETYVESDVIGSIGFIAPEANSTGRFTEKSDVYSFGRVLLEILTGRRVRYIFEELFDDGVPGFDQTEELVNGSELLVEVEVEDELGVEKLVEQRNGKVPNHSIREKENDLERYLKENILKEGNREQLMACGELAQKCVKVNPEERPTTMEVTYELKRIKCIVFNPLQNDSL